MIRHTILQPFTNRNAFRISFLIGAILDVIMLIGYFYNTDKQIDKFGLIYMFISNLGILYLLYSYSFFLIKKIRSKRLNLVLLVAGNVAISIFISYFISKYFAFLRPQIITEHQFLITNMIKDLILVLIVLLSTFLLSSVSGRQLTLLENERLIAENIRIRYESLKNQVDPHFLFNSLNTLDGLIGIDPERAHTYMQHLSQVFRYSIGNKKIVTLDEELEFVESYAHLMRIRYGENVRVEYAVDDKVRNKYILPISLQLLLENAIKHNVISNKYPLTVKIETTDHNSILVSNHIQPKKEAEKGEGVGLVNLTQRYELLLHKKIEIGITEVFSVEVPLIDKEDYNRINNDEYEGTYSRRRTNCFAELTTDTPTGC